VDPELMPFLPFILAGGVAIMAIAILVWRGASESSRRKKVEALSYTLGFDYAAEDTSLLESRFAALPLFSHGRRKRATNVLRRRESGGETLLFDYRYTTGSGKNSSTHYQTVYAVHRPGLSLPELELRPENLLHRIGGAFGYQDIDFAAFPEFSRRYLLRGKDEEAVRRAFTPALLQTLERRPGWSLEASAETVIVFRRGKRPKPDELHTFATASEELVRELTTP
jgi:hypothetical protein